MMHIHIHRRSGVVRRVPCPLRSDEVVRALRWEQHQAAQEAMEDRSALLERLLRREAHSEASRARDESNVAREMAAREYAANAVRAAMHSLHAARSDTTHAQTLAFGYASERM